VVADKGKTSDMASPDYRAIQVILRALGADFMQRFPQIPSSNIIVGKQHF